MCKKYLDLPVLFLIPGKDKIINSKTSAKVFQKLSAKDKQWVEYPDMHHALSIDLNKEKVFTDIHSWIKKRIVNKNH